MDLPQAPDELKKLVIQLMEENRRLRDRIKELEELLKRRKIKPPPAIKPGVGKNTESKKPKFKKKQRGIHVRQKSATFDHTVYHAVEVCPDCQVSISGLSIAYDREIIDIPLLPAQTTRHIVLKRRCWKCGKTWTPEVDLSDQVIGKSRMGNNLVSLTNFMTEWLRTPIDKLQEHLEAVYQLSISAGTLVELRHKAAHLGAKNHRQLQEEIRASRVVNADETGHRENGVNKYTWSYSTPKVRYFLYQRGRDQEVVKEVLGTEFEGTLCSDFYGSYNTYDGPHQRCWAHLLGDRHQQRQILESQLWKLASPYIQNQDHPFHTLAKRIDKHLDELFIYVLDPEIPATNNQAERSLRHNVISRKISGGTRSPCGSRTKEILASLFGTWHLRNLNPLTECRQLLTNPNYAIPPPLP